MHNSVPVQGLYNRRITLGISVKEVARRCHVCCETYYRWEQGKAWPLRKNLQHLSLALRFPLTQLVVSEHTA